MLQKMEGNIPWFECAWLQQWNLQDSWEWITWTIATLLDENHFFTKVLFERQSHFRCREPCLSVYHSRTVQGCSSSLFQVGSMCGVGPALVGIHPISLAARYRVAACSFSPQRSRKSPTRHAGTIALLSLLFLALGNRSFFFLPWPFTRRKHFTFFADWTVTTHLTELFKTKTWSFHESACGQAAYTRLFWSFCRVARVLGLISRHRVFDVSEQISWRKSRRR